MKTRKPFLNKVNFEYSCHILKYLYHVFPPLLKSCKIIFFLKLPSHLWGCPRRVMVKAMDCGIVVCEFALQSRYYVHWERYEPTYPPSYGLNSTTAVLLGEWLWH